MQMMFIMILLGEWSVTATSRIHKSRFILTLLSLNLYSPSPGHLLFSVLLPVVKGIRCPETDEDHHQNKTMDLGHSASS